METIEISINPEFEKLIPPLTKDEFEQLEKNILLEGIRDALVIWNGFIIDGHNRFSIAEKHGLEYTTIEKEFENEDAAKVWMIDNQKGRRNLTDGWKFELAIKRKEFLAEKGKELKKANSGNWAKEVLSESDNTLPKHNTRKIISDELGWSEGKTAQAEVVMNKAPEVWEKVKAGDVSINQAYTEIKKEEKKEERQQYIQQQRQAIESGEIELPAGVYEVISVDPPWNYGREYDPESSRVANPYPEMPQEQLLQIELPASDNSVLFLWTTHAFLFDAKELLDKWGFEYKATLVWNKQKMGMGAWFRMQCEFCLVGIKGRPVWNNTKWRDIIEEPRREHSRKPDTFFEMVDEITAGRKLEYFSREQREGWSVYGNDTEKF